MTVYPDDDSSEDGCGHAFELVSFNADLDLDPEGPLAS
jgi:hypothetical protein